MTRMSNAQEEERELYETAGIDLASALLLLDTQVRLRLEQAISEDAQLTDLLLPALDSCSWVLRFLALHRDTVAEAWEQHQADGWQLDE
jgi:hypothetical protein